MRWLSLTLALVTLVACGPSRTPAHHAPTATLPAPANVTCADLDAAWGEDWPATLAVLDALINTSATCGIEPLASKQYAALFSYAAVLEQRGDQGAAVDHYRAAFALDPNRREAWEALVRLERLPDPTPAACRPASEMLAAQYAAPAGDFAAVQGDTITIGGQPFSVRGVNYYPRLTPWHRFLTDTDLTEVAAELDLVQRAGFNTLRLFLRPDAMFTCAPEEAVPLARPFDLVDSVMALARERDLHIIVTLNDLPDLTYRPLYTDWPRYDAQTTFIVRRYRDDPTILAWDLRNEGDLDYGARSPFEARFSREVVLGWLAHAAEVVRAEDSNHLITAGWWGDPGATAPSVDFLSFHHWYDAGQLQARISDYQRASDLPLLLEEVGYHSWAEAPNDPRDEAAQAEILSQVVATAEAQELAGWMIWAAFDFAVPPGQSPTFEHFFGLWRVDLSPKPALAALPLP
jgi:hypothetical protein